MALAVTLSGPGGTGKTRLAIEAASELVPDFKAGVFWVGLASLRDPALVTETIAQTLGARDGLTEHIGERELLLLLDNLEQVVECAPELASLLEACPNLTLLVTSRELLRVRGEVEYAVPPLAEPEAVELFCARSHRDSDDTIAELCRHLDDMPLAVELAAARTSVLTPQQILERLSQRLDLLKGGRDAEARQKTLRATIEWSYELLTEEEQQLFACLAVFAGGCTLEAAEEVADADLDTLQSLVDKSLARFTSERYWMLETIRKYADERFEESGEAEALRQRHAQYMLQYAERLEADLHHTSAVSRLAADEANVGEALSWLSQNAAEDMLRLAGALWRFWYIRGRYKEGRSWLETALERHLAPSTIRARALRGLSAMLVGVEDQDRSRQLLEEALGLYRQAEDLDGIARCLNNLGLLVRDDDLDRARRLFEESVATGRRLAASGLLAVPLGNLADIALLQRDLAGARRLGDEALAVALRENDDITIAGSRARLAWIEFLEGNLDAASAQLRRALEEFRNLDRRHPGTVFLLACEIAAKRGRRGAAHQLLLATEAHRADLGVLSLGRFDRDAAVGLRDSLGLDDGDVIEGTEDSMTFQEMYALALDSID
jgi:predicted ATPase